MFFRENPMKRRRIIAFTVALAAVLCTVLAIAYEGQEDKRMKTATQPTHTNRLIDAASPYLLQHAHNPVDWYQWGPEALERARKEDKPIFLSIGYSACHWCHVMEKESFENEEIAALMNKLFVCIKVDREERPDLDEIYMRATTTLNRGQGGWPMSVWLTPELKPFAAGTYFPPTSRWGRPGFKDICEKIGQAWLTEREKINEFGERITQAIATDLAPAAPGPGAALSLDLIDKTADTLAGAFDAQRGGMSGGGTNKFPPSMAMDLMLRSASRKRDDQPRAKRLTDLVELTLDKMAGGGIYDQLAGGIHRYSTDVMWLAPHFEKMLYDQALVSRIYIDAFQRTQKPLYARIAREIFDYVIADLQAPEGGLRSTRDADSEGEEGKYYVWSKDEILQILGQDDGEIFCSYYDVSDAGNWEHKNILNVPRSVEVVAKINKIEPAELKQRLTAARLKLLAVRVQRIPPHLDDKILCEWNGLMISSLARGGAVLDEKRYVQAAAKAADFILDKQYKHGRLLRAYRDGRVLETAFLSDYACMIDGLIELYEATFEKRWLDKALELNDALTKNYWDKTDGGYFFTPHDHEKLLTRTKDVRDSAVPAGNSVQLMNLARLSVMLGDETLREMAERAVRAFTGEVSQAPYSSERFLAGVEFTLLGPVELAIVGDPHDESTQALLRQARQTYLPNRVIMLLDPTHPEQAIKSPLLEARTLIDDQPAAYVCRNYACKLPVTTPADLAKQLAE